MLILSPQQFCKAFNIFVDYTALLRNLRVLNRVRVVEIVNRSSMLPTKMSETFVLVQKLKHTHTTSTHTDTHTRCLYFQHTRKRQSSPEVLNTSRKRLEVFCESQGDGSNSLNLISVSHKVKSRLSDRKCRQNDNIYDFPEVISTPLKNKNRINIAQAKWA